MPNHALPASPDRPAADGLLAGRDPFAEAVPYRLIGPAERQQYPPLLMAFLIGTVAFITFQVLAMVAMGVLIFSQAGGAVDATDLPALLAANADVMFMANALGQFVGLGMLTVLATRLHTPDIWAYLRVQRLPVPDLALSVVGLVALLPVVSGVGQLSELLPWPEVLRNWDEQQQALVAQVLGGELNVGLALVLVAVVPSLFEEVLFRGYIQRNAERRLPVIASLLLVGFAFGLFHLRFVELLPLALLGVYLAFVVWVTGSLWAGVLVHLVNNGTAILASNWANTRPDPVALDDVTTPWYLVLIGLAVAVLVARYMLQRREARLAASSPSPSPHV